jgi:uncharacterized protein YndB with AHSA1/START domain
MAITLQARIEAPAPFVFEYLRDMDKVRLWIAEVEESKYTLRQEGQAVGTRFVQKIRQGFSLNTYQGEVEDYQHERLIRLKLQSESAVMLIEYRLEPEGTGCRMTYVTDMSSRNLRGAFLGMVFQGFSEGVLRRQLMTLKRIAEQQYRSTP